LARRTARNLRQNIVIAIGTVALLLVGLILGKVQMASGMLVHELSILVVILNAMRLIK
jgi:Cd2+/Zn2+-exporting ATPase